MPATASSSITNRPGAARRSSRAKSHGRWRGSRPGCKRNFISGNLEAKRDWGYAPEYVEAMWLMLQQERGDDYVVATGETHSVQEFLEKAFGCANLDWKDYVKIDPRYYRPAEVDLLIGDASKARKLLGWQPKTTFAELVRIMVQADIDDLARQLAGQNIRS